jgi:hypothetical protein
MSSRLAPVLFALALAGCGGAHEIADRRGPGFPPQINLPEATHVDDDVPEAPETQAKQEGGSRYGNLDKTQCESEIARRHIAVDPVAEARGVIAPMRLKGPLGGIDFHSMLPTAQRKTSPLEIYDCRLVLALHDFAKILARHDIVEVVHFSVYRPPPARFTGVGRRHAGALAIDAAIFKTKDGKTFTVEKDFRSTPMLDGLVHEAASERLFNVLLTPRYNWQHRNHFHLEVTAGVRWQFLR